MILISVYEFEKNLKKPLLLYRALVISNIKMGIRAQKVPKYFSVESVKFFHYKLFPSIKPRQLSFLLIIH